MRPWLGVNGKSTSPTRIPCNAFKCKRPIHFHGMMLPSMALVASCNRKKLAPWARFTLITHDSNSTQIGSSRAWNPCILRHPNQHKRCEILTALYGLESTSPCLSIKRASYASIDDAPQTCSAWQFFLGRYTKAISQ